MAAGTVRSRALPRDAAEAAAAVVRALADPLRLQIVSALATEGSLAAGEIATLADVAGPTVSHHLRALREAGVVTAERRGTWIHYRLAPGMVGVAGALLDALGHAAAASGTDSAPRPAGQRPAAPRSDVDALLARSADRLARRFPEVGADVVLLVVRDSYAALARTARVTTHLPVLAERFAAQRLEDQRTATARTDARPRVLFVCTANAGRSQLAAALLRGLVGDAVVVRSAGSAPAARIHATVEPLLRELLDPADGAPFPKPLTDDAVRAADVVVTMGCGDATPVLPGTRYLDWPVGDPALASAEGVRAIRDDLASRVAALAAELVPAAPGEPHRATT
jgi:arsenate reductase (thioredoxin)